VAAALAERWPDRVWECSHVGGDRFAPNVVLLPDGFYYGNLHPQSAVDVVTRHLAGTVPSESLRGMARFVPPVQAAAIAAYAELGPLDVGDVRVLAMRQVGPHDGHGSETFVDLEVAGHGRVAVAVLSVRRKEEQLTCRATRLTPATEYRIEGFQRPPASPG
jgi:(2Fe-2S) ferredoxin